MLSRRLKGNTWYDKEGYYCLCALKDPLSVQYARICDSAEHRRQHFHRHLTPPFLSPTTEPAIRLMVPACPTTRTVRPPSSIRITNRNSGVSVEHVEQLRFDVDRLRRERDDARAEAMRWLEQEKSKLEANAQATALAEVHKQRSAAAAAGSSQEISPTGVELGIVADGNGKRDNSAKAAAAIAKLRAKVERLRKERDEAEEQAAKWLNEQQANLRQQLAADMSMNGGMMNEQVHSQEGADSVSRDEVCGRGRGMGGVTLLHRLLRGCCFRCLPYSDVSCPRW